MTAIILPRRRSVPPRPSIASIGERKTLFFETQDCEATAPQQFIKPNQRKLYTKAKRQEEKKLCTREKRL
jgi:hypothetical protein